MVAGCHIKPEQFFNLIFGYNDTLHDKKTVTSTGTSATMDSSAVPAGEIWIVRQVSGGSGSRQATLLDCQIYEAATTLHGLGAVQPVGTSWTLCRETEVILKATDQIRGIFYGVANGDSVSMTIHGYKMKVSQ